MTLKANRTRAFLKTFLFFFMASLLMTGFTRFSEGKSFDPVDLLLLSTMAGVLFGLFAAFLNTPREIAWDDNSIRIRAIFPGSGEYRWQQLEAYSPEIKLGPDFLLIKFEGQQAYQIVSAGFSGNDWKEFRQFLRQRYPEKKAWIWLGPTPLRFGKKKS